MMCGRLTGARARMSVSSDNAAKIRRFFLTTKKKTLNNVKANVFVRKGFCLRREHLAYIIIKPRPKQAEKIPLGLHLLAKEVMEVTVKPIIPKSVKDFGIIFSSFPKKIVSLQRYEAFNEIQTGSDTVIYMHYWPCLYLS